MTTDEFIKLVAVVYLFLGGALTAVLAYTQVRNKNNAEAIGSLTKSVLDLSQELVELKREYDKRLDEKEAEISRLRMKVYELEQEIAKHRQNGVRHSPAS